MVVYYLLIASCGAHIKSPTKPASLLETDCITVAVRQTLGIGKPGLVSQLGRLATLKCATVYVCAYLRQQEWWKEISIRITDIIASSLQCVFLLFLKSIDLGRPRLSSPYCHIDQCHCSSFPPLNTPWTHHCPIFDLHPHLIHPLCCSSSFTHNSFFNSVSPSHHPLALCSPFTFLQPLPCFSALISSVK